MTLPPVPSPTSKRSKRWAAWPRPSNRAFRRCASKPPPRARRHVSIPASNRSSASTPSRPSEDMEVDVLKVDNAEVRARQLSKLQQLKGTRNVADGRCSALAAADGSSAGKGNLLDLAIRAARAHARSARSRWRWKRPMGGMSPTSTRFPVSTVRRSGRTRRGPRGRKQALEKRPAPAHVFLSQRWARTATIAARR